MEQKQSGLTIIAILFGIAVVIFIAINFYFLFRNGGKTKPGPLAQPSTQAKLGPKNTSNQGTAKPQPTIQNWKTYQDKNFQVTVPQNWHADSSYITGGTTLMLKPDSTKPGESFPRVDIMQITKTTTINQATIINQLVGSGFTKSSAFLAGMPVTRLHLKLEGKYFITGNPDHKDVIKDLYIFEKGPTVYQIDYAYYTDTDKKIVDQTLREIVDNFKISAQ